MPYNFDKLTILIVEDNQPILELTKAMLVTFGVGRIYTAADGQEGFDVFCRERPDIVLSDLVMEPADGAYLSREIRKNPRSPDPYVPIILITAFSEKERILEARDMGVTEFLVKPFNARDLYRRISQVIENPRKFVRSRDFFGPDRRRKQSNGYQGQQKRKTDIDEEDHKRFLATQKFRQNRKD